MKRPEPTNRLKQASLTGETCAARVAASQVGFYVPTLARFQFIVQIQSDPGQHFLAFTHKSILQTARAAAVFGCLLASARRSFALARPNLDMTVPAGHESIVAIS